MQSRRNFIQNSCLLSAGILLGNDPFFNKNKKNIGLQMYTLRKIVNDNNIEEVLEKVAAIGYKELEVFGYDLKNKFWGKEPAAFKKMLKKSGLKAIAAHAGFENFLTGRDENEWRVICEAASIIGNKYLVVAWLPEKYRTTLNDYKLLAQKLNKAGRIASQYGLQLAYHNHDFEFDIIEDDKTGYAILLNDTDSNFVKMELDLYWTMKAGVDPLQLFKDNAGRFPLWHVKDMDKADRSFTEVGKGSIDFAAIFKHSQAAGLKHFFIEQDEVKKEVYESIRQSFNYTKKHLLF
ncbi:MAG: sugar phosphate isomerase/epimerase [Sphingobacteriales bacterium]|nr:MAG: sugar phosphate isomerase/epimerase [Sphingobacteriales bacterium]